MSRVNTLAEQQKADRKSLDRLIRWKQRVNTVMSSHDMPIPADDDD